MGSWNTTIHGSIAPQTQGLVFLVSLVAPTYQIKKMTSLQRNKYKDGLTAQETTHKTTATPSSRFSPPLSQPPHCPSHPSQDEVLHLRPRPCCDRHGQPPRRAPEWQRRWPLCPGSKPSNSYLTFSQAQLIPPPQGYYTSYALGCHTFFAPKNIPAGAKLPVMVWGNGACSADSLGQAPFLTQLASYGVLIIVSGTPRGGGSTNDAVMRQSIDFITNNAGKGQWANIDASRITAAGFSCGGVEAYAQINDPRVKDIGIWSSGLLGDLDRARSFKKPVFFFLGGQSDIAFGNGERDYNYMPGGTPKWKGNLNVGHGGTYHENNGGKFGTIGARWVQWVMRGNATASQYLNGDGAKNAGWSVVSKDSDKLKVVPI